MSIRLLAQLSAVLLFLAVCTGAFGAHALKATLDAYGKDIWEKATLYHFVHALGMLLVTCLGAQGLISELWALRIGLLLFAGVVIFSGSLYALAISQYKLLGAITPIGGLLFLFAWGALAYALTR